MANLLAKKAARPSDQGGSGNGPSTVAAHAGVFQLTALAWVQSSARDLRSVRAGCALCGTSLDVVICDVQALGCAVCRLLLISARHVPQLRAYTYGLCPTLGESFRLGSLAGI